MCHLAENRERTTSAILQRQGGSGNGAPANLVEQENEGTAGLRLTIDNAPNIECDGKAAPFGVTIRDAVNFYLPHLRATNRSCTAAEFVDELLKAKEADGASERYLSDLRSRLSQFTDVFDGKPVAEITSLQIDEWLRSLAEKKPANVFPCDTQ